MLFIDTDHRIELNDLRDEDGNAVTGATVTATLFEIDRVTEVVGQTAPLALSDQGGGNYAAILDDSVGIVEGRSYWLRIVAQSGSAKTVWWRQDLATRQTF